MFKKWLQIIFDHRISLQERMFRVVTGVSMIALIFILPMGRTFMNWLLLAVSLAAIFMITKVSIQKERIITGATAIAVLLLLLFPVSFSRQAGSTAECRSGLCSALFTSALPWREEGRRDFSCSALWRPWDATIWPFTTRNWLPRILQQHSFFDSAISVIMVGVLTSVMLMFLNKLYEEENELSGRQKKEIEELNEAENHFLPV